MDKTIGHAMVNISGNRRRELRTALWRALRVAVLFSPLVCPLPVRAANAGAGSFHTVKWGETLARIAHRYYGQGNLYHLIADANHITDPHRILCGAALVIPPLDQGTGTLSTASTPPIAISQTPRPLALPMPAPLPLFLWRQEPYKVFDAGEKLTFAIRWKFITVGFATMEVTGIEDMGGRQAYHIITDARSAPFFDNFYKVRDINESWIDVQSLCSVKFESHNSENGMKNDETIKLDQEKRRFEIVETGKKGDIPPWVQDVLSSLYYLRTKNLTVGQELCIDTHSGDTSWPLKVKVLRLETVDVPAGRFICYVVEPAIREGAGLFRARGNLQVWLTADEKKIPVMMRSKIAIGYIDASLTGMRLK